MSAGAAPDLARLAEAFADRSRAGMCLALLDGRAWTAGELARHIGIAPSTATEHLHLLVRSGVVVEERQGRHRYVRLADVEMADLVETLAARAPTSPPPRGLRAVSASRALARGRTCYDHLAGALGVAITDALLARGYLSDRDGWTVTPDGLQWIAALGVDLAARPGRRPLARGCLDWTERRPHLAGAAGAALLGHYFAVGWIHRIGTGRAVRPTDVGRAALAAELGVPAHAWRES